MFVWSLVCVCLAFAPTYTSGQRGTKCCKDGDCYDSSPPFNSILIPYPSCPEEIEPLYQLFTRTNRDAPQYLTRTTIPPLFDGSRMTVIVIHGYRHDHETSWLIEIRNALLDRDDVNVIVVGWGKGSNVLNYFKAVSNTRVIGTEVAHIIDNLVTAGGASNGRLWCIGHSLGAHTCGHAGKATSISRISGLDPAGPVWDDLDISAGLIPSDADYVEVIHTHGVQLVPWGTMKARGDTDFYPNGGGIQPGCIAYDLTRQFFTTMKRNTQEQFSTVSCSHSRAYDLFIESIKQNCLVATYKCEDTTSMPAGCLPCENCPSMGYDGRAGINGLFYMRTSASAPFCI